MSNQLGSIGQNSAQEFFETILYMTAYSEANETIQDMSKEIDHDVLQEAFQGGLTVLSYGVVFMMIQKQEDYLNRIIDKIQPIVGAYLASANGLVRKGLSKIGGKVGNNRLGRFLRGMSAKNGADVQVATARALTDYSSLLVQQQQSADAGYSKMKLVNQGQNTMINKEQFHLSNANAQAQAYNQNLMFKLFSKKFTSKDKGLLRKITGSSDIDVQDMNGIADFMFVTDDEGKPYGLTTAFTDMLNGLGYLHNK